MGLGGFGTKGLGTGLDNIYPNLFVAKFLSAAFLQAACDVLCCFVKPRVIHQLLLTLVKLINLKKDPKDGVNVWLIHPPPPGNSVTWHRRIVKTAREPKHLFCTSIKVRLGSGEGKVMVGCQVRVR